MRIVFMGTPDFSVPALESLIHSRHKVEAIVTQPDRPKGRGNALSMSPVKETGLKYKIPVFQPERAREASFVEEMGKIAPDVMVVVAFGQILTKELLELPKYGCVNIHASLLPKYRGASPIQWAVIHGDKETGITTMKMDEGMDTGDILETKVISLTKDETGGSLFDRLSKLGGELILSTLEKMEAQTITATPQDHEKATYVKKIPKSMGEIDWTMDAESIERLIRGLNPWPSAYTWLGGKMLKLWSAEVLEENGRKPERNHGGSQTDTPKECGLDADAFGSKDVEKSPQKEAGVVILVSDAGLQIRTGRGILNVTSLQLEGKKRMDTASFLRGFPLKAGMRLERS